VFSGAVKKIKGEVKEGDTVDVYDNKDNYLATGHYQKGSIAVRIFSFEKITPDYTFWKNKIYNAFAFRSRLGLAGHEHTNCYRLVYAEGDGLPGLVIDFYNGTAVLQAHSIGMYFIRELVADALKEIYKEKLKAVYNRSMDTLPRNSQVKAVNGYLFGKPETNEVSENGCRFYVDWEEGQKTGFFIDQRENRKLLAGYCSGKIVLNTFCYTGAFSVYASRAGAKYVDSVDSSQKAVELTDKNMFLNGCKNNRSFACDTFDFLKGKENIYDVIILDPPAFAKHQEVRHNAVMGYKRLNAESIRMVRPGGIIFTFSCSQVISRHIFNNTVLSAAIAAKRNVRIIGQLSQASDHPVTIFHPEGEYLKGLVLSVD
jgi:23S rRNA (cytosine1962-C5)-methyltransferase